MVGVGDVEEAKAVRRATLVGLAFSVLIAWYVGFRPPSAWATTLQSVSITDGFYRRFVVGTLLRPFANATGFDYWVFATFSFLVLGALVGIVVVCAVRARHLSQRILVIAFFLLPTGGFLFHIVGYLDQVLYLMLFAAVWLLGRKRVVAAAVVMSIAPFVHEIAVLSILPVFGIVALLRIGWRTAIVVTLVPLAVNLAVLMLPAADATAIATLGASLQHASFQYRSDALELFARTQHATSQLYDVHNVVIHVRPPTYFVLGTFGFLWWTNRGRWPQVAKVPVAPVRLLRLCDRTADAARVWRLGRESLVDVRVRELVPGDVVPPRGEPRVHAHRAGRPRGHAARDLAYPDRLLSSREATPVVLA
jgi:hypothetical protein